MQSKLFMHCNIKPVRKTNDYCIIVCALYAQHPGGGGETKRRVKSSYALHHPKIILIKRTVKPSEKVRDSTSCATYLHD